MHKKDEDILNQYIEPPISMKVRPDNDKNILDQHIEPSISMKGRLVTHKAKSSSNIRVSPLPLTSSLTSSSSPCLSHAQLELEKQLNSEIEQHSRWDEKSDSSSSEEWYNDNHSEDSSQEGSQEEIGLKEEIDPKEERRQSEALVSNQNKNFFLKPTGYFTSEHNNVVGVYKTKDELSVQFGRVVVDLIGKKTKLNDEEKENIDIFIKDFFSKLDTIFISDMRTLVDTSVLMFVNMHKFSKYSNEEILSENEKILSEAVHNFIWATAFVSYEHLEAAAAFIAGPRSTQDSDESAGYNPKDALSKEVNDLSAQGYIEKYKRIPDFDTKPAGSEYDRSYVQLFNYDKDLRVYYEAGDSPTYDNRFRIFSRSSTAALIADVKPLPGKMIAGGPTLSTQAVVEQPNNSNLSDMDRSSSDSDRASSFFNSCCTVS